VEYLLGKVTGDHLSSGGPDALLDIHVERRWLREGRAIEIDLPRHLVCAACEGAGCGVCGQSGAITVRGRTEPPEVVRVTLPRQDWESDLVPESQHSIVLRIQGRGGLPDGNEWPSQRGRLLLRVRVAGTISECVREAADDAVVSSSTVSYANVVLPQAQPNSSLKPTVSTSSQAVGNDAERNPSGSEGEGAPETRRSLAPQADREIPQKRALASPQLQRVGIRRITWRDVIIGVVALLLGAAMAWLLV
jgi:hypothetical protein